MLMTTPNPGGKHMPHRAFYTCITVPAFTALVLATCGVYGAEQKASREQQLIAMIKSNASVADKDKACRELQVVGTRASVPALAALLPNDDFSHMARYALEPMPYPEAGQALRGALGKSSGKAKAGIITSLGYRRDRQAVPDLVKLLKDADGAIVTAAAAALGRIGTPEAANGLAALRSSASPALRPIAAEASLAAAEQLVRQGQPDAAASTYDALRAKDWPKHVRLGAFVGSLTAQPDKAVAKVIQAITGEDRELKAVAIANISALKGEAAAKRLATELPKLPANTQVMLIGALADRRDAAIRDAILQVGKASSGAVRAAAAQALGRVGDASCTPWLAQVATTGKTRQERDAASLALAMMKADGITSRLAELMAKADAAARPVLIEALMRRDDAAAVGPLLAQAGEPDVKVRRAAFKALARLAGASKLPALLGLLNTAPDDAARGEAEKAIAQVAREIPDETKRADAVLAALTSAKSPAARCSLLRVLGGIGGARSLAAVQAAMESNDKQVRDAAVRALASWPDAAATDALLRIYRTTEDRTHRVLALRGLVRVLSLSASTPVGEVAKFYREAAATAKDPGEKKLILSGAANVAHPDLLALAMAWVDDKTIHAEAALAAIKVGEAVLAIDRRGTEAAMKKLASSAQDPKIRRRAQAVLRRAKQWQDYVVAWQAAGPYSQRGRRSQQLFDVAFPPEKPDDKSVLWRALPARSRNKPPWILDLTQSLGGNQCLGYARTWVHSQSARKVRLEMGVDDGIKVWLNGKVVHRNNSAGAAVAGEEKVEVELKEGWNALLLKIIQHTGPWEFCARFRTLDGKELDGLRVDSTHGGPMVIGVPAVAEVREAAKPKPTPQLPPPSGETGWVPLFNGKDLTGWTKTGAAIVKVEDDCLVGTQTTGKGGDLWHERQWTDFELRATYRVVWPANSGIWFRHDGRRGYQFDILKFKRPVAFSGTLYCPGKMFLTINPDESLENQKDWNEACIRAKRDELTLWLNGRTVGHCRDASLPRGKIGIQVHGGNAYKGMQIVVKRIEVRPIGLK